MSEFTIRPKNSTKKIWPNKTNLILLCFFFLCSCIKEMRLALANRVPSSCSDVFKFLSWFPLLVCESRAPELDARRYVIQRIWTCSNREERRGEGVRTGTGFRQLWFSTWSNGAFFSIYRYPATWFSSSWWYSIHKLLPRAQVESPPS